MTKSVKPTATATGWTHHMPWPGRVSGAGSRAALTSADNASPSQRFASGRLQGCRGLGRSAELSSFHLLVPHGRVHVAVSVQRILGRIHRVDAYQYVGVKFHRELKPDF